MVRREKGNRVGRGAYPNEDLLKVCPQAAFGAKPSTERKGKNLNGVIRLFIKGNSGVQK